MTTGQQSQAPAPVTWTLSEEGGPRERAGVKVGVLALQGDFLEHMLMLTHLGVDASEVRQPRDLEELQAVILPGGESTTVALLMDMYGLREPLRQRIQNGMPAWGTCAGMIMLAREIREDRPTPLSLMDMAVSRNFYGRQVNSFEAEVQAPALGSEPFHAIFIRAPAILECGPTVEVLARLQDGTPVAARQGNMLVTSFHPELTVDTRFHSYFLSMVDQKG